MRQSVSESGSRIITIDFPNEIFFSRGKYAYIRIASELDAGSTASLTLNWDSESTTVKRRMDSKGVAVFRISSVLDSWAAAKGVAQLEGLEFTIAVHSWANWTKLGTAIIGLSDVEIMPLSKQTDPGNRPAAQKIVVYPSFGATQHIFVPELPGVEVELETAFGLILFTGENAAPFIPFDPSGVQWHPDDKYIRVTAGTASPRDFSQLIDIDYCTDGLFVKWIDRHGIPYLYRWSVESQTDEVASDVTYLKFDALLNPFEVNGKTLTRRRVLHSRPVDRYVYEMCKSIISGHDIQYYDLETDTWQRAIIEEGEAADDGAVLKDLVVELTDKINNL